MTKTSPADFTNAKTRKVILLTSGDRFSARRPVSPESAKTTALRALSNGVNNRLHGLRNAGRRRRRSNSEISANSQKSRQDEPWKMHRGALNKQAELFEVLEDDMSMGRRGQADAVGGEPRRSCGAREIGHELREGRRVQQGRNSVEGRCLDRPDGTMVVYRALGIRFCGYAKNTLVKLQNDPGSLERVIGRVVSEQEGAEGGGTAPEINSYK
ncbi:hypothetical protein K438DRAFT_1767525 [Mycena galopus ATCC 62051]|nr:hypothetical protein K438DRAFT_1767525 [Mycena galopus ATCC 62051]